VKDEHYVTVIRNEHRISRASERAYRMLNLLVISGPRAGRNIWFPLLWAEAARWAWEGRVADPRDLVVGSVMRVRLQLVTFQADVRLRVGDWDLISIPKGEPRYMPGEGLR
jgi:hypothetical protein